MCIFYNDSAGDQGVGRSTYQEKFLEGKDTRCLRRFIRILFLVVSLWEGSGTRVGFYQKQKCSKMYTREIFLLHSWAFA